MRSRFVSRFLAASSWGVVDVSLRIGLVGWPVEHSLSPAMHNAALAELGLEARYELLPTPPDQVEATLERLRSGAWLGVNVTVPHKQAVIPFLDELGPAARAIGAVNTICWRDGRLLGDNTDAVGFVADLRQHGFEPAGCHALLLGAGGAARAVAYGLASANCAVTLWNRTAGRAAELAADLMASAQLAAPVQALPAGLGLDKLDASGYDLLVNCTSLGMWPQVEGCPWPAELDLPAHWWVYDLVYNPAETRLMARARAAGAPATGGQGMLLYQGARALELWTGRTAPVEVMRAALQAALAERLNTSALAKELVNTTEVS